MGTRIALSALPLRPGGSGVQTYIRELMRELPHVSGARFTAVVQEDAIGDVPDGMAVDRRPVCAGGRRAFEAMRSVGEADLVHGLDVDLPLRPGAPTVITVHDLSVFDVPWAHPGRRAAGERFLIRNCVRRADAIIAVSGFTAERVHERFGREATVTHLAPSPDMAVPSEEAVDDVIRRLSLPDEFVLHLGTVEPRKDVPTLGRACADAGVPLVLAGAVAAGETVPPGAQHLGYVDRGDVPALYGAATVVAYPSRYEGFGLPPIEAMACGAAVVATRTASLPEVLGDAAVLVPPQDATALSAAIADLVRDSGRRDAVAAAGQARVADMSWRRTAEKTVEVYRSLGVAA